MTKQEILRAEARREELKEWERTIDQDTRDSLNYIRGLRGMPVDPHGFHGGGRYDKRGCIAE